MLLVGVATVYIQVKPPAGSATWWLLVIAVVLLGALAAPIRLFGATTKPILFTVAGDVIVAGLLWLHPQHAGFGMLFVPLTAMVALYHGAAVLLHMILVSVALRLQAMGGGSAEGAWMTGLAVICLVTFLRVLVATLRDHVTRTETMQALLEMLPVLKAHGVQEVVQAAVVQLVKATASESGIVMLLDRARQTLYPYFIHFDKPIPPEEEEAIASFELAVGDGLAGWVALHGQPLISGDAERDPRGRHVPGTAHMDESLMIVPLMTNGELYGVLRLHRTGLNMYRPEDMKLLELMAAHVSDALSRAALEERLSRTDALTGAYNRHYLNEWANRLKPNDQEIAVLMADCRSFKQINDTYGHLVGDQVLRAAADLLQESVRSVDLVVRYGGDEFLVVLKNAGLADAEKVAQRVQERVQAWNDQQGPGLPRLTLDIGVDCAKQSEWNELLARADLRMYANKRAS